MHICVVASQSKRPQVAKERPSKFIFPLRFPKFVCWLVRHKHGSLKLFSKKGKACLCSVCCKLRTLKVTNSWESPRWQKNTIVYSCFRMHPSDGKMQMGLSQEPCKFPKAKRRRATTCKLQTEFLAKHKN